MKMKFLVTAVVLASASQTILMEAMCTIADGDRYAYYVQPNTDNTLDTDYVMALSGNTLQYPRKGASCSMMDAMPYKVRKFITYYSNPNSINPESKSRPRKSLGTPYKFNSVGPLTLKLRAVATAGQYIASQAADRVQQLADSATKNINSGLTNASTTVGNKLQPAGDRINAQIQRATDAYNASTAGQKLDAFGKQVAAKFEQAGRNMAEGANTAAARVGNRLDKYNQ